MILETFCSTLTHRGMTVNDYRWFTAVGTSVGANNQFAPTLSRSPSVTSLADQAPPMQHHMPIGIVPPFSSQPDFSFWPRFKEPDNILIFPG